MSAPTWHTTDKHLAQAIQRIEREHGADVRMTSGNHIRVKIPGCHVVFISGTPGDWRIVKNFEATINKGLRERAAKAKSDV